MCIRDRAKTGWELTKVARIGRSRSVYSQKRVAGGVGQSREPKVSVCCLHISAHPFLAKNRPGAPVFGHCPKKNPAGDASEIEKGNGDVRDYNIRTAAATTRSLRAEEYTTAET